MKLYLEKTNMKNTCATCSSPGTISSRLQHHEAEEEHGEEGSGPHLLLPHLAGYWSRQLGKWKPHLQRTASPDRGRRAARRPSRLDVRKRSLLSETESKRNHSRETWLETKQIQFPDSSAFSPELFAFAEAH